MRDNNLPTETAESLRPLKRRIYLGALAVGLLAIFLGWVFKAYAGTATPYDRAIFPILTVLCLVLFISPMADTGSVGLGRMVAVCRHRPQSAWPAG